MAFPVNILSAEWREVKQVVGHKKAVQAPSIRGVRVEQVISLLVEDTQARMLALEWLFHRLVVVDDWFYNCLIQAHIEVPVEVRAERGVPRKVPTHSLLVLFDLGDRSTRNQHQGGVGGIQVSQRRGKVVGEEAAARASGLVLRAKHEMIDDQLLAALKELCQGGFAIGVFERVFLVDLHHREIVPKLIVEGCIGPNGSFLLLEKLLASSQPLIA